VIGCEGGRIVSVDLQNRHLTFNASKDDSLSHLSGLKYLALGTWPNTTNRLVGPLPLWLGKLGGSLMYLKLTDNQLTGPIDVVRQLTALTNLVLSGNPLTGPIDAVKGLTNLTHLSLDTTSLMGPIDVVINLTKLTCLHLYHAGFSGVVPAGDWSKIDDCNLQTNNFACPLPTGARAHCGATCDHLACNGTSSDLDDIDCAIWQKVVLPSKYFTTSTPRACNKPEHVTDPCSCTGVIGCEGGRIVSVDIADKKLAFDASKDDSLSHLSGLKHLALGSPWPPGTAHNQLEGPFPPWLAKLSSLASLNVEANNFTGHINTVQQLTNLASLDLGGNHFTGPIDGMKQLSKLTSLHLHGNRLTGSIDALKELTSLTSLGLNTNQFNGTLDALRQLTNLEDLGPAGNQFTGTIEAVGQLTNLVKLALNSNKLTGPIDVIGKLTSLEYLNLDANEWPYVGTNHFTGTIPADISKLTLLTALNLGGANCSAGRSAPQLHGSVDAIKSLTKLNSLYLNCNQFTGSIDALKPLTALSHIELDNNHFTGSISPIAGLTALRYLDLSINNLTGTIDALKALTSLTSLDLSVNYLSGPVTALADLTKLTNLNLHDSSGKWGPENDDFSGKLPNGPIDFGKIAGCGHHGPLNPCCNMQGSHFACPLPDGAAKNCKASCH
jgi:Leucine-rich repeat (LRR) protein